MAKPHPPYLPAQLHPDLGSWLYPAPSGVSSFWADSEFEIPLLCSQFQVLIRECVYGMERQGDDSTEDAKMLNTVQKTNPSQLDHWGKGSRAGR